MYCCMRRVWSDCRVYICNQDVTMDERAGPSTSSTSTPPLPEAYIEGPSTSAPPFPPPTHASPLRCRPHRCIRAAASVSLHAAVAHRFHSRCCRSFFRCQDGDHFGGGGLTTSYSPAVTRHRPAGEGFFLASGVSFKID